jgi:hypothetical protein
MLFFISLQLLTLQNAASTGFKFSKNSNGKAIPVKLFEHFIFMPVKVNHSQPLYFILDTGAEDISYIEETKAVKLNLISGRKNNIYGAGENTMATYSVGNVLLSLPGIDFADMEFYTMPLKKLTPFWGLEIEGILGGNVLEKVVTEINYENGIVYFYDPVTFQYSGPGERIPIAIHNKSPYVKAKISAAGMKEPIEGLFLIDTGLRGMVFAAPFHQKYGLTARSPRVVHNTLGFGIGGESRGSIGRIKSFSIGGITFNNPVVSFSSDKRGVFAQRYLAGAIGTSFLHRFQVIFNYKENEMILEKNKFFHEPFEYNMIGIYFIHEGENLDQVVIYNIIENSPAAEIGLKKGDIIVSINNRKSASLTKDEIKRIFIGENKRVRLDIQRNGNIFTAAIVLRRLV